MWERVFLHAEVLSERTEQESHETSVDTKFCVCELCVWPGHSVLSLQSYVEEVSLPLIPVDLCDSGGEFSCRLQYEIILQKCFDIIVIITIIITITIIVCVKAHTLHQLVGVMACVEARGQHSRVSFCLLPC